MIYGVTHGTDGSPIQRLTVGYKVSIGIPAGDGQNYPSKSDHFHVRAKNGKGEWIDDREFSEQLRSIYMGEALDAKGVKVPIPLREFDVLFLSDDVERVFKTEFAWWAASEKKCSGDGQQAMRSIAIVDKKLQDEHKGERYIPWEPCGKACPDLEAKRCKPSGQLFFMFKDRPVMGSVAAYSTTSYETILRIYSSLLQIKDLTGGRLKGIPLKMVMRPGKTSYIQDGKRRSGAAFFVNIEFRESDYKRLIPKLMEFSAEYNRSLTEGQKMITSSSHVDEDAIDVEPEENIAEAMTNEFYPDNRQEPGKPEEKAETGNPPADPFVATCNRLGLNPAHREMLAQSLKGDVGEMEAWITTFAAGADRLKLTPGQINEFFTRAALTPAKLADLIAGLENPGAETDQKKPRTKKNKDPEPPAEQKPAAPEPPNTEAPKAEAALTNADLGTFEF